MFTIHVVESDPPPSSEPSWRGLKVGIGFLRDGMYALQLRLYDLMPLEYVTEYSGYSPGIIAFAGKCSDAHQEITMYRRYWRVEFGQKRGRPRKSWNIPEAELLPKLTQAVNTLRHLGDYPSQAKVMKQMGVSGDPARAREWAQRLGYNTWRDFLQSIL
jgi:hypothetical protein